MEESMQKVQLIATSAFGLEAVVGKELKKMGYHDQHVENGKVTFSGDTNAICKSNLWLRTADRVLIKVGEFKALSFEEAVREIEVNSGKQFNPLVVKAFLRAFPEKNVFENGIPAVLSDKPSHRV
jgi:putative N6-adenine-specific DNA methylase